MKLIVVFGCVVISVTFAQNPSLQGGTNFVPPSDSDLFPPNTEGALPPDNSHAGVFTPEDTGSEDLPTVDVDSIDRIDSDSAALPTDSDGPTVQVGPNGSAPDAPENPDFSAAEGAFGGLPPTSNGSPFQGGSIPPPDFPVLPSRQAGFGGRNPFVITPSKKLGEPCTRIGECSAAFAHCIDGQCTCISGFAAEEEKCVAQSSTCPFGGASTSPGESCTLSRDFGAPEANRAPFGLRRKRQITAPFPPQFILWQDSCPEGSFCSLHDPHQISKGAAIGHCCPVPSAQCPVGRPLNNATCGPPSDENLAPCPIATHYCHSLHVSTNPGSLGAICCPRPCPGDAIYKDGRCLLPIPVGQSGCNLDEQCAVFGGVCNEDEGKCECPKGAILQQGFCAQVFCQGGNRLLPPQLADDGSLISCNDSTVCFGTSYCARDHRICCPSPEPYCPPFVASQEVGDLCDPSEQNIDNSTCGPEKVCFRYFFSTEGSKGGVCCDRQIVPPSPA